jgi:hypothetical protein
MIFYKDVEQKSKLIFLEITNLIGQKLVHKLSMDAKKFR